MLHRPHANTYRSDEIRNNAAEDLRVQVTSYTQEFPGHDSSKEIWGEIFHRTFDLTRSNTLYERLGATKAIETMLVTTNEDTPDRGVQRTLRLYECESRLTLMERRLTVQIYVRC